MPGEKTASDHLAPVVPDSQPVAEDSQELPTEDPLLWMDSQPVNEESYFVPESDSPQGSLQLEHQSSDFDQVDSFSKPKGAKTDHHGDKPASSSSLMPPPPPPDPIHAKRKQEIMAKMQELRWGFVTNCQKWYTQDSKPPCF